jgi:hypothetical protein
MVWSGAIEMLAMSSKLTMYIRHVVLPTAESPLCQQLQSRTQNSTIHNSPSYHPTTLWEHYNYDVFPQHTLYVLKIETYRYDLTLLQDRAQ